MTAARGEGRRRLGATTRVGCTALLQGWVEEGDAGFEDADEEQVDDQEDEEFLEEAGKRRNVVLPNL